MTPELNELLKKIATAKGITAILVMVFVSIFVWYNIDFLTEVSFTIKNADRKTETPVTAPNKKENGVPQLALGDIILPPAPKNLPSIVVFEIKNRGTAITNNVHATIDFGGARVIAYEMIGAERQPVDTAPEQSIINVEIAQLMPRESAYIYAQTSTPIFKLIILSSKSTIQSLSMTMAGI